MTKQYMRKVVLGLRKVDVGRLYEEGFMRKVVLGWLIEEGWIRKVVGSKKIVGGRLSEEGC